MGKLRIVIRAFTCRRDVAPAELLARVLSRLGCDVLVTSMRDFERTLHLWKPHAAVVNTPGQAMRVKSVAPDVVTVWIEGEGFLPDAYSHALTLSKQLELFRAADLVLLWGQVVYDQICTALAGEDIGKIKIVGNPKLDLVRYLPDRLKIGKSARSVGVVCRFPGVNHHEGRMPIKHLPNPGNLARITDQAKGFVAVIDSIRAILSQTDFSVSLRPHPNEQLDSYARYLPFWFGADGEQRVSVDGSLDFASWAAGQQALLSPSSTSFLEAYLLNVPVINLDYIAGTVDANRSYDEMVATWQSGGIMPADVDELCSILKEGVPAPSRIAAIDEQLANYCDCSLGKPACLRAAQAILQKLQVASPTNRLHFPAFALDIMGELSFRRAMRINPLHHNFNYCRSYHSIPDHYDEMVAAIMREA